MIKIDVEKFYAKIVKIGDSAYILIPAKVIKFGGYELGNDVEVFIKRK